MCVILRQSDITERYSLNIAPLSCVLSCGYLYRLVCLFLNTWITPLSEQSKKQPFYWGVFSVKTLQFSLKFLPFMFVLCLSIVRLSGHRILFVKLINWNLFKNHSQRLTGMHYLSYKDRLKALGLERLELRRLHADLIVCYKIVHGLVNILFQSFFELNSQQKHSWSLVQTIPTRLSCRYARSQFSCASYFSLDSGTVFLFCCITWEYTAV